MTRRLVLQAFALAVLVVPGCGPRIEVIPRDKIRAARTFEIHTTGDSVLVPVGTLKVQRFAEAQAREWDPGAQLICVSASTFFVGDGKARPKLWAFIYKSRDEAAWLGVLVGREGILDAATRRLHDARLKRWPLIPRWTVDYDSTISAEGQSLVAVRLGADVIPVWRVKRLQMFATLTWPGMPSRQFDHKVENEFVHALTNLQIEGDTLVLLEKEIAARPWVW